jgi:hypothetical protein
MPKYPSKRFGAMPRVCEEEAGRGRSEGAPLQREFPGLLRERPGTDAAP